MGMRMDEVDEQSGAYEMLTKNIASLLQIRVEEVQTMIPHNPAQAKEQEDRESVSGTSGYGSGVGAGTSPPPLAHPPAAYLRQLRGRGSGPHPWAPLPTPHAYAFPASAPTAPRAVGQRRSTDEQLREMEAELALTKETRRPKPGYLCRICFTPGHLIFDCPQKHLTPCLTPYKGPKQCYGEFACAPCKRKWRSGKSFANAAQPCKACGTPIFPHRQYSLEKAMEEGKWPIRKEANSC